MSTNQALTATSFERLLQVLDPNRDRAGHLYEQMRRRVAGLFEFWGASHTDELADRTFDRVARKLDEGVEIRPGSFGPYVRGVARMIFYESGRAEGRHAVLNADLAVASPAVDADPMMSDLDGCLQTLTAPDRDLILRYYDSERGVAKIEHRRRLASRLGITGTALRVRTHRIRQALEDCVMQRRNVSR